MSADKKRQRVVLTYELGVGANYLRFKDELAESFPGMRETKLLTSFSWDESDIDPMALTTYIQNHKEIDGFIIVKGVLIE